MYDPSLVSSLNSRTGRSGGGGLDGAGTDAEYRRDLCLGQAEVVAQHEDLVTSARQPGQGSQHLTAILGQDDLALGRGERLVSSHCALQHPGPAGDDLSVEYRPATVEHGDSNVRQRSFGRGPAPPGMQVGVNVLHDVLGGGQVPYHKQSQPDQLAVVVTEQHRDGTRLSRRRPWPGTLVRRHSRAI